MLEAAGAAGVVYAHRLHRMDSNPRPDLLAELLAGKVDSLTAAPVPAGTAVSYFDNQLDFEQREAVRQALSSPDVFLVQGAPGPGKSRVITELITQEVKRGQTVLFLAPSAAALDQILLRLADREGLLPIRSLGAQERHEELPPEVSSLSFGAQAQRLSVQAMAHVEARRSECREQTAALARDQDILGRLRQDGDAWQELETQRRDLQSQRQRIVDEVAGEVAAGNAPGISPAISGENTRHDKMLSELDAKVKDAGVLCAQRITEREHWVAQVRKQGELLAARQRRAFFTLGFWRALLQGRAQERFEEFRLREVEANTSLQKAQGELADLEAQRVLESQRHETALAQITQQECSRRQLELDRRIEEVLAAQQALELAWTERRRHVSRCDQIPARPDPGSIREALAGVEEQRRLRERESQYLAQWHATLGEFAGRLPNHLLAAVNVVGATIQDIAADPRFGDRGTARRQFDVVILDQADRVTESELLLLARRAARCVLVGQPRFGDRPAASEAAPRQGPLGPFHRLWQTLHCDPRRLPYEWVEESTSVTCRLLKPTLDSGARIETEHLADHPEVALRILSRPNAAPALAEVVFPIPKFSTPSAKAYLYQQLGELTLRPIAGAMRWRESQDRLLLETAGVSPGGSAEQGVELEDGVREVIRRIGPSAAGNGRAIQWATVRLEFEKQKGWDLARARTWLRERAALCSLGRTALLENQWRLTSELSAFCEEVLGEAIGEGRGVARTFTCAELQQPIQFFAVPFPQERPRHRHRGSHRPPPLATKVFEIDLSDPRQRQRLPLDLQLKLPQRGIVNFAEAQAIMHTLDMLTRAPGLPGNEPVHVEVLSWQNPQVQFLGMLWSTAGDRNERVQVSFRTAMGVRERDADIVLLSLCRSNAQRGTGYADYPEEWRWALCSARSHLLIFGDLDMLARRGENQGPVSRQSEAAAALERTIAQALVRRFDHNTRKSLASPSARS
jgi:hypothetical protein